MGSRSYEINSNRKDLFDVTLPGETALETPCHRTLAIYLAHHRTRQVG